MKKIIFLCLVIFTIFAQNKFEQLFTDVYRNKSWGGGDDVSGRGSIPENLKDYIQFLTSFISENNITNILDIGCGSFKYFSTIDLSNTSYIGIDIVKELMEINTLKYGTENIKFIHGNAIDMDLPESELVICKYVLQHLPNKEAIKIIKKLKTYPYCILINQCQSITPTNANLSDRPIDLLSPPFSLKADYTMTFYIDNYPHQLILIKNKNI